MKAIRRLTFTAISAFFVCTAAFLWTTASAKVARQTKPNFAGELRKATGLRGAYAGPLGFVDGLFQAPWRGFDTGIFGSGFGPTSFALGDVDGDGDVDILVGDSFFGSPGISVLKNDGDQTLPHPCTTRRLRMK